MKETFSHSSLHSIPAAVSMIENSYSKYFENCFIMDRPWSFAALHCTLRVCSLSLCEVFRGLCQLVMSMIFSFSIPEFHSSDGANGIMRCIFFCRAERVNSEVHKTTDRKNSHKKAGVVAHTGVS